MKADVLVLEIDELGKIIPDINSLNERSFKNLQDLLTNVINTIESSSDWQFVNYLQNKPSLFIIRRKEKSVLNNSFATQTTMVQNYQKITDNDDTKLKKIKPIDADTFIANADISIPQSKLPWEK